MNSLLVDQRFEVSSERNLNCALNMVFASFRRIMAVCLGMAALFIATFILLTILSAGLIVVTGLAAFVALIFISSCALKLWGGRE